MHEASIAREILDTALAAAPNASIAVRKVTIVTGTFAGIEPSCLSLYFDLLAENTQAAGACLEVVPQSAAMVCTACSARQELVDLDSLIAACRICGQPNRIEGGHELYVRSIEVEE
jgi:hydrogenase nickel insertion protein HypA